MSSRPREFGLMSYLSEDQIMKVFLEHHIQIRAYAYAYHDMDVFEEGHERAGELKEPHYHIVLYTFNGHSVSAVLRWFMGFKDEEGKNINTFAEKCRDRYYLYDYLDHSNSPDKYQYDHSIIVSNDFPFFEGKKDDMDTGNLIIEGLKSGQSYEVLRKRFGTHFILNFNKYKQFLEEELVFKRYDPMDSVLYQWLHDKQINEFNSSSEDLTF